MNKAEALEIVLAVWKDDHRRMMKAKTIREVRLAGQGKGMSRKLKKQLERVEKSKFVDLV